MIKSCFLQNFAVKVLCVIQTVVITMKTTFLSPYSPTFWFYLKVERQLFFDKMQSTCTIECPVICFVGYGDEMLCEHLLLCLFQFRQLLLSAPSPQPVLSGIGSSFWLSSSSGALY